jgi:hypothetical protein
MKHLGGVSVVIQRICRRVRRGAGQDRIACRRQGRVPVRGSPAAHLGRGGGGCRHAAKGSWRILKLKLGLALSRNMFK